MATDYSTLSYDELLQHCNSLRDEVAFLHRHVAAIADDHAQAISDQNAAQQTLAAAEAALAAFVTQSDPPDDAPAVIVKD